jgi:phospholipid N-methyltransferase
MLEDTSGSENVERFTAGADVPPRDEARRSVIGDNAIFLRAWADRPSQVAAIAPSGRQLAELITREITPATGPVLELGPGTGVFTRMLLERGVRERDLTLVEARDDFATVLRRRFPEARILCMDATRLARTALFEDEWPGAAVSGLPLRKMSPKKVLAILGGAFAAMRPEACLYQFTYRPGSPIPRRILARLGLEAIRTGAAVWNVPPAAVYRLRRIG